MNRIAEAERKSASRHLPSYTKLVVEDEDDGVKRGGASSPRARKKNNNRDSSSTSKALPTKTTTAESTPKKKKATAKSKGVAKSAQHHQSMDVDTSEEPSYSSFTESTRTTLTTSTAMSPRLPSQLTASQQQQQHELELSASPSKSLQKRRNLGSCSSSGVRRPPHSPRKTVALSVKSEPTTPTPAVADVSYHQCPSSLSSLPSSSSRTSPKKSVSCPSRKKKKVVLRTTKKIKIDQLGFLIDGDSRDTTTKSQRESNRMAASPVGERGTGTSFSIESEKALAEDLFFPDLSSPFREPLERAARQTSSTEASLHRKKTVRSRVKAPTEAHVADSGPRLEKDVPPQDEQHGEQSDEDDNSEQVDENSDDDSREYQLDEQGYTDDNDDGEDVEDSQRRNGRSGGGLDVDLANVRANGEGDETIITDTTGCAVIAPAASSYCSIPPPPPLLLDNITEREDDDPTTSYHEDIHFDLPNSLMQNDEAEEGKDCVEVDDSIEYSDPTYSSSYYDDIRFVPPTTVADEGLAENMSRLNLRRAGARHSDDKDQVEVGKETVQKHEAESALGEIVFVSSEAASLPREMPITTTMESDQARVHSFCHARPSWGTSVHLDMVMPSSPIPSKKRAPNNNHETFKFSPNRLGMLTLVNSNIRRKDGCGGQVVDNEAEDDNDTFAEITLSGDTFATNTLSGETLADTIELNKKKVSRDDRSLATMDTTMSKEEYMRSFGGMNEARPPTPPRPGRVSLLSNSPVRKPTHGLRGASAAAAEASTVTPIQHGGFRRKLTTLQKKQLKNGRADPTSPMAVATPPSRGTRRKIVMLPSTPSTVATVGSMSMSSSSSSSSSAAALDYPVPFPNSP